jgi:hypothetical protein
LFKKPCIRYSAAPENFVPGVAITFSVQLSSQLFTLESKFFIANSIVLGREVMLHFVHVKPNLFASLQYDKAQF